MIKTIRKIPSIGMMLFFQHAEFKRKFRSYLLRKLSSRPHRETDNKANSSLAGVNKKLLSSSTIARITSDYSGKLNFVFEPKETFHKAGFCSILVSNSSNSDIVERLYKNALKDEFVGFRVNSLFIFEDHIPVQADLGMAQYFEQIPQFRNYTFSNYRNVVSVDPENLTSLVLKESHNTIRLIVIISTKENHRRDLWLEENWEFVDSIILPEGYKVDHNVKSFRYNCFEGIIQKLKSSILDNSSKEENLLLPAYSKSGVFKAHRFGDVIDEYNKSSIEGVIVLERGREQLYENSKFDTFLELIQEVKGSIEEVYLKEEQFLRYTHLCNKDDVVGLIKKSIQDGVRYEIV